MAKDKDVKKVYTDGKNEVAKNSDLVTKVIVYLSGEKAKPFNTLGKLIDDASKKLNALTELKKQNVDKLTPEMLKLFTAADRAYTCVVETSLVVETMNRATKRPAFNQEKFIAKLCQKFPKNVIDELIKECTTMIDVDVNAKVSLKKEGVGDTIRATYQKIQVHIAKYLEKFNKALSKYDDDLDVLKREIMANVQFENYKALVSQTQRYLQD